MPGEKYLLPDATIDRTTGGKGRVLYDDYRLAQSCRDSSFLS